MGVARIKKRHIETNTDEYTLLLLTDVRILVLSASSHVGLSLPLQTNTDEYTLLLLTDVRMPVLSDKWEEAPASISQDGFEVSWSEKRAGAYWPERDPCDEHLTNKPPGEICYHLVGLVEQFVELESWLMEREIGRHLGLLDWKLGRLSRGERGHMSLLVWHWKLLMWENSWANP